MVGQHAGDQPGFLTGGGDAGVLSHPHRPQRPRLHRCGPPASHDATVGISARLAERGGLPVSHQFQRYRCSGAVSFRQRRTVVTVCFSS